MPSPPKCRFHHATRFVWSGLVAAMLAGAAHASTSTLVTGKRISLPPLGINTNIGSLPMNMVATPDGKFAVTSDMGFRQKLSIVRTTDGTLTSSLTLGDPTANTNTDGLYYGLAIKANSDSTYTIYASRGAAVDPGSHVQPGIGVYSLSAAGVLVHTGDIAVQHGDFPAGLALSPDGQYLYVADNQYYALLSQGADALKNLFFPGYLLVYNTATGQEAGPRVQLNPNLIPPPSPNPAGLPGFASSSFPLAVAVANGNIYVTSQRDGLVSVLSASNPASPSPVTTIQTDPNAKRPTEAHPAGLTVNKAGTRLYVANAHSDTISVIDTFSNTILNTISLRPANATDLPGVTPLGLTLSPDEKTLYAALGDMNAVAVVSLASGKVGYIPTGWYPTAVVNAPYRRLLVTNAKGINTRYPNPGYQQFQFNSDSQYDLNQIEGTAQLLPLPNALALNSETQQVLANNRIVADTNNPKSVLPPQALAGIKHVIYIIKENRTYDQVLGDLPQGNGDPSITIFGQAVTPNLHALASRFVLLDNFYDCAEASGDGWPWSTQGLATEYVIKNLPYNYSGRGRNYDFEGTVNNYPVSGIANPPVGPHGNALVASGTPFASGGPAIPDVSEAPGRTGAVGGHIWDNVRQAGMTYRNYGFFLSGGDGKFKYPKNADGTPAFTYSYTPGNIPDNYPASPGLFPASYLDGTVTLTDPAQVTGSDVDFRKYDNAYPDSDAPITYYNQSKSPNFLYPKTVFGAYNQFSRFAEWNREFQIMLAQGKAAGQDDKFVPSFMTVRFHHDHTQGYSAGVHTPRAEVADNDYAVGQLVQAVSADPAVWNSTAIFVIEDDSQDGADHVDVHRSTAYVISPWIRQNSVDHTFYNTDSMLKTMEQLLDLPPMSQYDAVATPILDFDTTHSNSAPYAATLPAASIIGEVAPTMAQLPLKDPRRRLALLSATMNFEDPDSAPARLLNQVIWQSIKGTRSVMTAPRHVLTEAQLRPGVKAVKGKAGARTVKTATRDSD